MQADDYVLVFRTAQAFEDFRPIYNAYINRIKSVTKRKTHAK